MNPVAQGLPVHPGQPRRARTVHPFQRVGDREQTSGNPAIALLPRLPAQFLRTDVIPDHHGTHCGLPLSPPQYLLPATYLRCNPFGESASTQVGITGSARTVSEALENLARHSATTNEALVIDISRSKDEVTLPIRHAQEFDESHRQFFELLALWFVRTLHKETNRHFNPLRITFTHARNSDLREVHRLLRCPVDFAQAADTWVLPHRVMDLPIVSADSHLLQILTAHADDLLAERHSVGGLQSMVVNQLVDLLPAANHRPQ